MFFRFLRKNSIFIQLISVKFSGFVGTHTQKNKLKIKNIKFCFNFSANYSNQNEIRVPIQIYPHMGSNFIRIFQNFHISVDLIKIYVIFKVN